MQAASGDVLLYIDAACRAPIRLLDRIERRFLDHPDIVAVTGPYRFYDWDWIGVLGARVYDYTLAPFAQITTHYLLNIGAVLYGGNFAVGRSALNAIGGFDTSIEFHGEDTNLGRRLAAVGTVDLNYGCYIYTSARRYKAMGRSKVFRLYVRKTSTWRSPSIAVNRGRHRAERPPSTRAGAAHRKPLRLHGEPCARERRSCVSRGA